ncbi:MAG: exodeoxyribonuclease VII small subunit [Candidatus Paceibacterota bacterium]
MPKKKDNFNFKDTFKKLEEINSWFQEEEIDLDEALEKYKEGVGLIKEAKKHLKKTENEFEEIQKELSED